MKFEKLISEKNLQKNDLRLVYQKLLQHFEFPTVFLFQGEAGMGKTESVRMFADILNYEQIASPSFAIINQYRNQTDVEFSHVDLYRLQDTDDLESSGFWDLFVNEKQILAIEWADRLNLQSLPMTWNKILIHITPGQDLNSRNIEIFSLVDE